MAAADRHEIRSFSHRVAICSMEDVVESSGTLSIKRNGIYTCWARIKTVRPSIFDRVGDAVDGTKTVPTHNITIRMRRELDFTTSAWLFDERKKSPSRWFRVISYTEYEEDSNYIEFACRLYERSVESSLPVTQAVLPQGVRL